jgi:hypothetical protein
MSENRPSPDVQGQQNQVTQSGASTASPASRSAAEALASKRADWEFERRFNRVGLLVLLSAMPLAIYVGLSYVLLGVFSAPALCIALAVFVAVVFAASALARRSIAAALRSEGLAPENYRPPGL